MKRRKHALNSGSARAQRPFSEQGKKLKALRTRLGKSQEEVCEDSGVDYAVKSYWRIENGIYRPPREKLLLILIKSLRVDMNTLSSMFNDYGYARPARTELYNFGLASHSAPSQFRPVGFIDSSSPARDNGVMDDRNRNRPETMLEVPEDKAKPQNIKWAVNDGGLPGIRINSDELFVPWADLKPEVEKKLLPQVRVIPVGSTVELGSFQGRENWLVRVFDPDGLEVCHVWFGGDPYNEWKPDYCVRLGVAISNNEHEVWQVFRRYSDKSYRRVRDYLPELGL